MTLADQHPTFALLPTTNTTDDDDEMRPALLFLSSSAYSCSSPLLRSFTRVGVNLGLSINACARTSQPKPASLRRLLTQAAFHTPKRTRPPSTAWRSGRRRIGATTLFAAANGAALGTAAFVTLSEKGDGDDDKTAESRMLEVSRAEIAKKVDDDDHGFSGLRHRIVLFVDLFIWEPICTGFRFLHLAAIFIPVIITVPVMWFGRRQPDRGNETSGTLWWYGFLVKAMEWAGPAFIKVGAVAVMAWYRMTQF